jgi:hypothetical protein
VASRDGTIGIGIFFNVVRRLPDLHWVGHTGSWIDYAAFLAVYPDEDVGLFAAFLQPEISGLSTDLAWGALASGFASTTPKVGATPPADMAPGRYLSSKRLAGADLPLHVFVGGGVTSVVKHSANEIEIVGVGRVVTDTPQAQLKTTKTLGLSSLAMTFETNAHGQTVLWRSGQREAHVRASRWAPTQPFRRFWFWAALLAGLASICSLFMGGSWPPIAACFASGLAWTGLVWQSQGMRTLAADRRGIRLAKIASWALVAVFAFAYARFTTDQPAIGDWIGAAVCLFLVMLHAASGLFRINVR